MKWNDIPFDSNAEPEVKALEFDLQVAENAQTAAQNESQRQAEIAAEQKK